MVLTKSGKLSLYTIASTASNAVSVGAALDVSTIYNGMVRVRVGRATGTGFTVSPIIRLEASGVVVGSVTADDWVTITPYRPALGANIGSQAVSGTAAAAATSVVLAAGTNFAADDFVFFHNTTLANSEWKHVVSIATATLTLQDGLVRAQTGATARNQSEEYSTFVDLTGINSLRIVVDGATGTGQAVIIQADLSAASGV